MNLRFEFHRKLFMIIISSIPPKSFRDLFDTHSGDGAQLPEKVPFSHRTYNREYIGINYNYNVRCIISCGHAPITKVP